MSTFKQLSRLKYVHVSGKFTIVIEAGHAHISLFQKGVGRLLSEEASDLEAYLKEPSLTSALCSPNQGVRKTAQTIKRFMEYCDA